MATHKAREGEKRKRERESESESVWVVAWRKPLIKINFQRNIKPNVEGMRLKLSSEYVHWVQKVIAPRTAARNSHCPPLSAVACRVSPVEQTFWPSMKWEPPANSFCLYYCLSVSVMLSLSLFPSLSPLSHLPKYFVNIFNMSQLVASFSLPIVAKFNGHFDIWCDAFLSLTLSVYLTCSSFALLQAIYLWYWWSLSPAVCAR